MKTLEIDQNVEQSFVRICDQALKAGGLSLLKDINAVFSGIKEKKEELHHDGG